MKRLIALFLALSIVIGCSFSFTSCEFFLGNDDTSIVNPDNDSNSGGDNNDIETPDNNEDDVEKPNPDEGENGGNEKPNPDEGESGGNENPDPDEGENGGNEKPNPDEGESGGNEKPNPDEGDDDVNDDPEISECKKHVDANSDKYCDNCKKLVVIVIDFYAVNDLHGKFLRTDEQPGVGALGTYFNNVKNTDDNVVILSSGDMWQGASESNLTRGFILTEWMNEMDFVSMTLGNHEFDWGEQAVKDNLDIAKFPFLAINIYNKSTGKRVDYCAPSVMVERDGIKIGIIGAVGNCYSSISSDKVQNIEFKVGKELTNLVKDEAAALRAAGADLIVYSLHDGSSGYDSSLSNGIVDVVFEGHTHSNYVNKDAYGIYHLQGGGENKGISHVEITVNLVDGKNTVTQADFISSSNYSNLPDDPATLALKDKYADAINSGDEVLGNVSKYYDDQDIEYKVAELYLRVGMEKWGSDYDIVLGGGFLRTRSPYNLYAGKTTYSDILSLFPFDNEIVLCSIKGSDLNRVFVNTSNSDYHNSYSTYGNSIKNSISSNKTYYVVVDMYTAQYASNRLTVVEYYDYTTFARDLLAEEIRQGKI